MRNLYVICALAGVFFAVASVVLGFLGVLLVFAGPPVAAVLIAGPRLDRRLAWHYLAAFVPQTLLVAVFANVGGEVEEPIASGRELVVLYFAMSALSVALVAAALAFGGYINRVINGRVDRIGRIGRGSAEPEPLVAEPGTPPSPSPSRRKRKKRR